MNLGDADHQHDLTDDQLNALLAAADSELLQHIQGKVDSTTTLLAVMTGTAAEGLMPPPEQHKRGASNPLDRPAEMIAWRVGAHRLLRDIDFAHNLAAEIKSECEFKDNPGFLHALDVEIRELVRQVEAAFVFARDLVHGHGPNLDRAFRRVLDVDVEEALIAVLTRAQDRANDLSLAAVHPYALEDISYICSWVASELSHARSRARQLCSPGGEIDASGADLSHLKIHDLNAVAGVVWTEDTIWPPGLRSRILARSREIRDGVFQVHNGTERTSVFTSR
ncbi:hypothetical protein [Amycolatopsis sp. NPDC004169]|uniref:hypothetical protein n=1 Tax=Amycolatopsis sp. NPDC004169 TaxID=3154453 RepID=UPI0033A0E892